MCVYVCVCLCVCRLSSHDACPSHIHRSVCVYVCADDAIQAELFDALGAEGMELLATLVQRRWIIVQSRQQQTSTHTAAASALQQQQESQQSPTRQAPSRGIFIRTVCLSVSCRSHRVHAVSQMGVGVTVTSAAQRRSDKQRAKHERGLRCAIRYCVCLGRKNALVAPMYVCPSIARGGASDHEDDFDVLDAAAMRSERYDPPNRALYSSVLKLAVCLYGLCVCLSTVQ